MRRQRTSLQGLAALLLLGACLGCAAGDGGDARLAGRDALGAISCQELVWYVQHLTGAVAARSGDESDSAWRLRMLQRLAVDRRLAAESRELGGEEHPLFVSRLATRRERLALEGLEAELQEGISVTGEEARRFFEEHRKLFRTEEKLSSRIILLKVPPGAGGEAWREAEERLEGIRQRFLAGESFGELARRHSEAENAPRGGAVAARPRGSLLPAFEEVAWALEPGEVSPVVRLPDGPAIILQESVLPAIERSFEEVEQRIRRRLQRERLQARRQEALAEARSRWEVEYRFEELERPGASEAEAGPVVARIGGKPLRLGDLGLAHRPPWLRSQIETAVEGELLLELALERGYHRRPEAAEHLRYTRQRLLSSHALDRRLEERLPRVSREELEALYQEHSRAFAEPEQRRFAVLVVPGAEERMRPALETARELARRWRRAPEMPPGDGEARLEAWGPLSRQQLARATSPHLAEAAFALSPGEVGQPLRLERYHTGSARFFPEGYAVLRPLEIRPSRTPELEEVRGRLERHALRQIISRLAAEIRGEVLQETGLEPGEDLPLCPVSPPAPRRAAG